MQQHTSQTPASWYDESWGRRKRIVLSKDKIAGKLDEFPLLVELDNDPDIARYARLDGRDIVFTAGDGVTKLNHQRVVHQKVLRDQAVWTIWTDPRAIRHVGSHDKTYISYYTTNKGWWISSYDHETQAWQHFQLRSYEASAEGRWWDDHNNPAITVRKDGRIVAVYGEHSTHKSWCRISVNPEDITAWSPEIPFEQEQALHPKPSLLRRAMSRFFPKLVPRINPDPAYSYVDLYTLPDGCLWRQYRPLTSWSGKSRRPSFVLSHDGGETWGDPVRLIEQESRTPYLVTAQSGNRIHLFFSDAHPDEWDKTSIYHAYYDHKDGTYRRSDGSLIGDSSALPIKPSDATKVFDGTTPAGEAWGYHVQVDDDGKVAGLFNVYSGELVGRESHRVHEYWYAYWDGAEWKTNMIDSEVDLLSSGQRRYSGGFVVDSEDLSVVYLSLVDPSITANGFSRHIWRYTTPDEGKTWSRTQVSHEGQGKSCSRPVVPLNRHPDLPVVWLYGHYVNYFEYWTGLVAGEHGDRLDSQHFVRVPHMAPDEDLVLFVYYDNQEAEDQSASPDGVWPSNCRAAYKGTLTQNDLRESFVEGASGLTVDMNATWASNRRGYGDAPLLSNWSGDLPGLMILKNSQQRIEVRVKTPEGEFGQVFDDLPMAFREWRHAFDPTEQSIVQVSLIPGSGIHCWLNGKKSMHVGDLPGSFGQGNEYSTLRVGYSPDNEEDKFEGWLDSLRIYEGEMPDVWLRMSYLAEFDNASLLERGREETYASTPPVSGR